MKTLQQFQQANPKNELPNKALKHLKGGTRKVKKAKKASGVGHGCPPPFDEQ